MGHFTRCDGWRKVKLSLQEACVILVFVKTFLLFLLALAGIEACCISAPVTTHRVEPRGIQFIPIDSFRSFTKERGTNAGELVLTSRQIRTRIRWDELIASWNMEATNDAPLRIDVRAFHDDHVTKWFTMGLWSADAVKHPRESVRGQKDSDGDVDTDTLVLTRPADRVQVRLTVAGGSEGKIPIKFLGLSLLDTRAQPGLLSPNQAAWGRVIDVPQRSQMNYENGNVICSPTTVSMMLAHWSRELGQPSLDHDVPDVVKGVYDPQWRGTGNWVFNTAYAGSLPGMRACTARLSDVAELEDWIEQGMPVGLSVCYNLLRGKGERGNGHLIVCVGFTENGDVIVNDPGTSRNVRKVFPRANLINAWAYSKNTVYLIYPENAVVPPDRFGHWPSWTAHGRVSFRRR